MIRGSPRTPDSLLKLPGTYALSSEVFGTVISACGPYNLGGSTIEWYQSDHYIGFCSIVLQKLQNDLGQIN